MDFKEELVFFRESGYNSFNSCTVITVEKEKEMIKNGDRSLIEQKFEAAMHQIQIQFRTQ